MKTKGTYPLPYKGFCWGDRVCILPIGLYGTILEVNREYDCFLVHYDDNVFPDNYKRKDMLKLIE